MTQLATIGYEGADQRDFVATLVAAEISVLIDVRELAISRRKGFAKKALSAALAEVGISYIHLKSLGDPKPGRDAARAGDFQKFRRIFAKHMQSDEAISDLKEAMRLIKTANVCLMCFERDPATCHRKIVADAIYDSIKATIIHLGVREGASNLVQHTRARRSVSLSEGVASCGR